MLKKSLKLIAIALFVSVASGCATQKGPAFDYTAFKQSHPRSIVILPPVNESPDVSATNSVLSVMTFPLAEAGYYVFPVALVNETFKQNGFTNPNDIQTISPAKLSEIFGADTALYVTVNKYGTSYVVINSVVTVTVTAKLVDLKTGTSLWHGTATATNNQNSNNSGGLIGLLVAAAIKQIANSVADAGHPVAALASVQLLSAGKPNGMLYGPYSDHYGKE